MSTPFDVIKTRVMNQGSTSTLYRGPLDCLVKTVRTEGPLAMYKGFAPTYFRLAPWQLIFFVSAEQLSLVINGHSFTSGRPDASLLPRAQRFSRAPWQSR